MCIYIYIYIYIYILLQLLLSFIASTILEYTRYGVTENIFTFQVSRKKYNIYFATLTSKPVLIVINYFN